MEKNSSTMIGCYRAE